jgi:flavin-binding protein dodecin
MSVAKVIEISSESKKSFEDAIRKGIERAAATLDNVKGAWVKEQTITVDSGKIVAYQVNMMVTFILEPPLKVPKAKKTKK